MESFNTLQGAIEILVMSLCSLDDVLEQAELTPNQRVMLIARHDQLLAQLDHAYAVEAHNSMN